MSYFDLLLNEISPLLIFSLVPCNDCDILKIICRRFHDIILKNTRQISTHPIMTLEGHRNVINLVTVFKNGKKTISTLFDKTLKI